MKINNKELNLDNCIALAEYLERRHDPEEVATTLCRSRRATEGERMGKAGHFPPIPPKHAAGLGSQAWVVQAGRAYLPNAQPAQSRGKYLRRVILMKKRNFVAVDEEQLVEKVILANTVRVKKEHIEDIEEYIIESFDSNETMELEDAKEHIFLTLDELTSDEVYYLNQDGHIYLEELELLEYIPRDCFNRQDEEYEKGREIFKEYLEQSIIEKMKTSGFKASYLILG